MLMLENECTDFLILRFVNKWNVLSGIVWEIYLTHIYIYNERLSTSNIFDARPRKKYYTENAL